MLHHPDMQTLKVDQCSEVVDNNGFSAKKIADDHLIDLAKALFIVKQIISINIGCHLFKHTQIAINPDCLCFLARREEIINIAN